MLPVGAPDVHSNEKRPNKAKGQKNSTKWLTHTLFLLYYLLPKRCFNFQPRKKNRKIWRCPKTTTKNYILLIAHIFLQRHKTNHNIRADCRLLGIYNQKIPKKRPREIVITKRIKPIEKLFSRKLWSIHKNTKNKLVGTYVSASRKRTDSQAAAFFI